MLIFLIIFLSIPIVNILSVFVYLICKSIKYERFKGDFVELSINEQIFFIKYFTYKFTLNRLLKLGINYFKMNYFYKEFYNDFILNKTKINSFIEEQTIEKYAHSIEEKVLNSWKLGQTKGFLRLAL